MVLRCNPGKRSHSFEVAFHCDRQHFLFVSAKLCIKWLGDCIFMLQYPVFSYLLFFFFLFCRCSCYLLRHLSFYKTLACCCCCFPILEIDKSHKLISNAISNFCFACAKTLYAHYTFVK